MQTSAINGFPIYQASDTADYGTQQSALVKAIDSRSVPRFSTTTAADQAMGTYTAGGGVLADGMMRMIGGYPQIYRAGSWRGVIPGPLQATTFYDTTWNGSGEVGVASLSVPDQGCPYFLDCSGTVTIFANSGVLVNAYIRLDAVAGTLCSPIVMRDGLLPNGSGQTLTFNETTVGPLTGAHTVLVTVRTTSGSGPWAVQAGGNILRAVPRAA